MFGQAFQKVMALEQDEAGFVGVRKKDTRPICPRFDPIAG